MTLPRWVSPGAVAFLLIWLLLLAGGRSAFLNDPGTFWHTTTGELILGGGMVRTDPYTFTFAGEWWEPHQWLGEVGMALAHRVGGFDTELLAAVTLLSAVFAWLASRLVRTGLDGVIEGALVALTLAAAASHLHVRPHLFTIAATAARGAFTPSSEAPIASSSALMQRLYSAAERPSMLPKWWYRLPRLMPLSATTAWTV